jgi:ATP-dependent Clp protease adaptor protein ClpS
VSKKKKKSSGTGGTDLLDKEKAKNKVKPPSKYQVVFYNDDFTPMQLVVIILMDVFRYNVDKSSAIMMEVHQKDRAIAGGPYSKEISETKANKCIDVARSMGYPLLAKSEKV